MAEKYKEPSKEMKPKGVKQTQKMSSDIQNIINRNRGGNQALREKLQQEAKDKGLTGDAAKKFVNQGMQLAMNTPKKTVLR